MIKEVSLSIVQACNMIDNSIMVGYPEKPIIRADAEDLREILDFISKEVDRFKEMPNPSESPDSLASDMTYRIWLVSPLRELEYAIKRVLNAADEEKGGLTNKLDEVKTEIRRKAMEIPGISNKNASELLPGLPVAKQFQRRDSRPATGKRKLRR
jgi:hypothetical protein